MEKFLRLHQELHARPLPDVCVGSTILHLAMFRGEVTIQQERQHLDALAKTLAASIRQQTRIRSIALRYQLAPFLQELWRMSVAEF